MPASDSAPDEFALISRHLAGLDQGLSVLLGNGDDAALLALQPGEAVVVSTDAVVEGRHFPPGSPPADVAYRAVAAALSDLAAMGARPLGMTLTLAVPAVDELWFAGLRRGLEAAVGDFALPLVGGDLTRGPLNLGVQVLGAVQPQQALRRSGARPGDSVFVSGELGLSAAGLAVLQNRLELPAQARERALRAFWRPAPAISLGRQLIGHASAAIDVSDGLLADLGHLAAASGVAVRLESACIPQAECLRDFVAAETLWTWAVSGGEDYVLCFTLPGEAVAPQGCTRIGEICAGEGVGCDRDIANLPRGFTHF